MGGKHFRQTAGSCKGVIVWLNDILHIQADLALPVAHSQIFLKLVKPQYLFYKLSNCIFFTYYTAFILMYLFMYKQNAITNIFFFVQ